MHDLSVRSIRHLSTIEQALDLVLPSGDAVQAFCERVFPELAERLSSAQRRAEKLAVMRAGIDDDTLLPALFREAQRQGEVIANGEHGVAMGPLRECMDELLALWTNRDPVERAFARLDPGWFALDAPRTLTVGVSGSIGVSAIRSQVERDLLRAHLQDSQSQVAPALLSKRLRVELVPHQPAAVRVQELSPREQPVLQEEITLWEWVVMPRQSVEQVRFSVAAANLVQVGDQLIAKSIPLATIELRVNPASAPVEADSRQLSRSALRKLLCRVLMSDDDLNAFCLDYFPDEYQRFTLGMDRVQKYNLVLERCAASEILAALHDAHPEATRMQLPSLHSPSQH